MICNRCGGTGFLNANQVPADVLQEPEQILDWLIDRNIQLETMECTCHINPPCARCELLHDVAICDCCGNGDHWYNEPGHHINGTFDCM